MASNGSTRRDDCSGNGRLGPGPHEDFLELAALSTAGDLTPEEQKLLQGHLTVCADCRQALREFEAAANVGAPLLAAELAKSSKQTNAVSPPSQAIPIEATGSRSAIAGLLSEIQPEKNLEPISRRNNDARSRVNWNFVWLPLAAAILLTVALGIYAYRFGEGRGVEIAQANGPRSDITAKARLDALEQQLSDSGHERGTLTAQLAQRDALISDLQRKMQTQTSALREMQAAQATLESSVRADETDKQRASAQERNSLKQDLSAAETSLRALQAELDAFRQKQSEEQFRAASLEGQIRDLYAQLRDREQAMNKDEELLAHDRDIRDLMGARDLYIAEVYDVGRDGATQKPYGRVFYTRGKSLVFYAYDLDKEAGAKGATFQAWGRRGPETEQALHLGVFYKDDVGKKRWALKFDDPKLLEQIDAVFVTLEPNGEHQKPSGKPLLFAYLKVSPNHP